ncbi:MAG: TonB-dependent receptor, partial [Saprospiraceae bacterium]|nr:TonB-dependent receptor [Saprospiraceae bacterium]
MIQRILWGAVLSLSMGTLFSQRLSGRVVDHQQGNPIEFASILLYSAADSTMISGTVSDAEGAFKLDFNVDSAFLSMRFMGFKTYSSAILFAGLDSDLGEIPLRMAGEVLSSVEVTGRKVESIQKIDRQVYAASQFENARGGTALDVLANIPSLSINSFGEISIRGASGFLVMIDETPSQIDPSILLRQLSANNIADVEVITAPSARYDPDGYAGIIHIKTEGARQDGLFSTISILGGLPSIEPYENGRSTPRYGIDLMANLRKQNWDIAAGLNYRRYDISGRREGYVNTYLDNVLTEFPSDGERSFDEKTLGARLLVTHRMSKKSQISAGVYAGKRTKDRTADILYLDQQHTRIPATDFAASQTYYDLYRERNRLFDGGTIEGVTSYFNENLRVRKGDFFISSLDYRTELAADQKLSISGLYERTVLGGPTDNTNFEYPSTAIIREQQFNDNSNPLDGYRFQIDYENARLP